MKRCPECTSGFPDTFEFCERDGATLVADFWGSSRKSSAPPVPGGEDQQLTEKSSAVPVDPPGVIVMREYAVSGNTRLRQNWQILAFLVVAGLVVGVILFLIYQSNETPYQNANQQIASGALTQQPIPILPARSAPSAEESPSPEPSPSPSVTPSPSPTTQVESASLSVSSGMVSTSGNERTGRAPITIRLTNGNNIEADEVWQTDDGIWYRRRGIATLLERKDVKTIERADEKRSSTPASSAPTPASSPTATP